MYEFDGGDSGFLDGGLLVSIFYDDLNAESSLSIILRNQRSKHASRSAGGTIIRVSCLIEYKVCKVS